MKNNLILGSIIKTVLLIICTSVTMANPFKLNSFNKKLNSDTLTIFHTSTEKLKSNYIPDSIFKMINLKHLSIQGMDCDYRITDNKGNDITKCWMIIEISSQIKNFKYLEELQLNVNSITKIPIELIELENLKSLDLSDNSGLSNIDNIVKLEKLEYLSLNGCNILKLPDNIRQLKKLKSLGLVGNNISDIEKERIKKLLPNCKIYF